MWSAPVDRLEMPLPSNLDFLYPVLRIPLWLRRTGKRLVPARRP
jgi:hypothetical protein